MAKRMSDFSRHLSVKSGSLLAIPTSRMPLMSAVDGLAVIKTDGGSLSKEVVTKLTEIHGSLDKLRGDIDTEVKDDRTGKGLAKLETTVSRLKAELKAELQKNTDAVKASDELAKKQMIQWAISNCSLASYRTMRYVAGACEYTTTDVIVREILLKFMKDTCNVRVGVWLDLWDSPGDPKKRLSNDQASINAVVQSIHELSGMKPCVGTVRGRKAIYQSSRRS